MSSKEQKYAESFDVLSSISNEREIMLEWVRSNVLKHLGLNKTIRFLSVGAGPGDFDKAVINDLLELGAERVVYTAVEPAQVFASQLIDKFENNPIAKFELNQVPFEEASVDGEYDLVLFSHSLHYISDKEAAIKKALACLLKQTGVLVLVHQASLGVTQIQKHFVSRLGLARSPGMISESLFDVLDSLSTQVPIGWEYSLVRTEIETTKVVDENSPVGAKLFEFLLDVQGSEVTPENLRKFRLQVAEMSYAHKGRLWMLQPLGVFKIMLSGGTNAV